MSKNSSNSVSPSTKISSRKRKIPKKDIFVEMEEVAYETLNISKRRIKSGQYLKDFLDQTSSKEAVLEANKRAITSLLFSSIRSCDSPSASAYIFPKEHGSMGQLYAGNLEEKKIIYVLETLTKYPRVIFEMIQSEEEIKFLNAGVVQIIVESCLEG
ncbi:unnamed protein product, partial [marine sediment metagenome]